MDRDLVSRAQHGDSAAFDELAASALPRLWSIARRVVGDPDAAQDVVQNTLVRAWRDLRALRDLERFDAWLYRILVNACRDQARSRPRVVVSGLDHVADLATPSDAISRSEQRDEIARAFSHLSVDHRAALVLHHYLGFRATEVAAMLGVPEGTITSRLHYGSRAMRAALESDRRLRPIVAGSVER